MPAFQTCCLMLVGEEVEFSSATAGMKLSCLIPGMEWWILSFMEVLLQGDFLNPRRLLKKDTVWKDTLRKGTGTGEGIGEKGIRFLQADWIDLRLPKLLPLPKSHRQLSH